MSMIGGVFDNVPDQNRPVQYVVIGDNEFQDWGAHDIDGFECNLQVHCFVRDRSKLQAQKIMNRIYDLFHKRDFEIVDQKTVVSRFAFASVIVEPDNRTHHGVIRFNLILGG